MWSQFPRAGSQYTHNALSPQARLQRYGRNELQSRRPTPAWCKLLAQFWNPLTALLLVATVISFVVWWIEQDRVFPYESFIISAIVLLNGILGYVQEHRAERAVVALQAMTAATAKVLRDGHVQTIPTAEVVPGDILIIEEGDTIAADARVLEAVILLVDRVGTLRNSLLFCCSPSRWR